MPKLEPQITTVNGDGSLPDRTVSRRKQGSNRRKARHSDRLTKVNNNITATRDDKDVYEFQDDEAKLDPLCLRRNKKEDADEPMPEETIEKSEDKSEEWCEIKNIEKTPEKCGRLKLTLRMKRSPVLDEVIESGNSLSEDSFEPEYEVLRVEGVECTPYSHKKKRHKSKDRKRDRKVRHIKELTQLKRLRLVLGNETHTIDIPSTSSSYNT